MASMVTYNIAINMLVSISVSKEAKPGVTNLARTAGIYLASRLGLFTYREIAGQFEQVSPMGVGGSYSTVYTRDGSR
jgi:hypothetical protein